ncbi:MAG: methylated-DNA--[protein]-cysteine S-methyltransferase [Dehalococcoidia bacterium]|nr:methylated-DNA--[protein]-cysteine S-methyltransferase [Dehalococcoidia bacterium]
MKRHDSFYDVFPTSLGWVGVLASSQGLRRVTVPHDTAQEALDDLGPDAEEAKRREGAFEHLRQRLERHFLGQEVCFPDALDLEGAPPFFRAVWEACRAIPRGETRSYLWLAVTVGRPGAARAAGQAMARNPIAILIPCHRVVRGDGGLGGYGGGVAVKAALLRAEGAAITATA